VKPVLRSHLWEKRKSGMELLVERDQEDSEAIKVIYNYLLLNRR
jgi:hypothetical protein